MVRAIMIVEMAGRPAEHLKESLEKHVGILNEVKDIEVHEIKVSEPRVIPAPAGKEYAPGMEMFTAFAECDIELPTLSRLTETMFDFMPSSVEVIEPNVVNLEISEATDLMNNVSGRLHRYDEIAKVAGERLRQLVGDMQKMQQILIARDKEIEDLRERLGDLPSKEEMKEALEKVKKKESKKKVKKKEAKKKKAVKKKK